MATARGRAHRRLLPDPSRGHPGDPRRPDRGRRLTHQALQLAGEEGGGRAGYVPAGHNHAIRRLRSYATRENWYEPRLRNFKPSYRLGWPPFIEGLDEPERFRHVPRVLDRRGVSEVDIAKILDSNWVRYFRDIIGG